jgi:hypothetical protein
MDPIGTAGTGGITAATPLRVFLSHTSDLGKPDEPGSFVAAAVAAVLRASPVVSDMAYSSHRTPRLMAIAVPKSSSVAESDRSLCGSSHGRYESLRSTTTRGISRVVRAWKSS